VKVTRGADLLDLASDGTATGALGGQVSGVSVSGGSAIPGKTSVKVTVAFNLATAVTATGSVTITWPAGMFAASSTPAVDGGALWETTSTAPSANSWKVVAKSTGATSGSQSLVFTVTMGSAPMGKPCAKTFWVNTNTDIRSVDLTNSLPALGGQVSAVKMTIASSDRVAAATGKSVIVEFTLATDLTTGSVTVTWPPGFFSSTPAPTASGGSLFGTATTVSGNTWAVAINGNGPTAGKQTITFTGVTMGTPTAGSDSITVESTYDAVSPAAPSGPIGMQVTGVSMNIAAADRSPAAADKPVTIAFTIQTALAIGDFVTINYPEGFFASGVQTAFTQAPADIFTSPGDSVGATSFKVTAAKVANPGTYTLTFTKLKMGPPTAPSDKFSVSTTRDCGSTLTTTGNIGGAVTAPTLTIAAADRVAAANRKIVIGFTLASALATTSPADTITVTFPGSFISGTPLSPVTGTIAPTAVAISNNQLVLTAAAAIGSGKQEITVCGLTLSNFQVSSKAVTVTTSKDYSASCTETLTVGPAAATRVTAVSMSIPFASRSASAVVTPVIAFTTTTAIQAVTLAASGGCAAALNFITIAWPTGFFVRTPAVTTGTCTAQPDFAVTGLPTGYTLSAFTDGQFVLTGSAPIAAATKISLTFSGLSLGSAYGGSEDGIKVTTTADTDNTGTATAPTGPISGYQVTDVKLPTCKSSATDCQPFEITFNSKATVVGGAADGKIHITFSNAAANMPLAGTPDAFMSGGVLWTGVISNNVLTLTADARTGSFVPGDSAITFTLTGMTVRTPVYTNDNYRVYMSAGATATTLPSSDSYAGVLFATGTTVTTTGFSIDKPFPGVTGARATVNFATSSALTTGGKIYMSLPVGFFVTFSSVVDSCGVSTTANSFTATTPASCVTMTAANIVKKTLASGSSYDMIEVTIASGTLAAGANSFVLSGVTLSAAAVASSTTFRVTTSSDFCSPGAIGTGSISNSNPGGPSASSAASVVLGMTLMLSSLLMMLF